jgi:hypothetical protein
MNRDQIENAAANKVEMDLSEFMPTAKPVSNAPQYVNINGEVSPAVLAGILGCSDAMIYKYRQNGMLPPNSDASYRDSIKHHVLYYKNKSANKATGLSEAALLQKVQLDRARTESTWLQIKKDRGQLVDVDTLAQVFEPHFLHMRTQLCSIARKFPEVQKEIDAIMNGWARLGEEMRVNAQKELDDFIEMKMEEEIQIEEVDPEEAEAAAAEEEYD